MSDYVISLVIFLVFIFTFSYEFSHSFRLYMKFGIYYACVLSCSVLCVPFIIWRPGDVRNTLIATWPLRVLNPLLGIQWEIRGVEHITPDRAAVVVCNHQSSLDFLGMVYMWPLFSKISAIAKKEIFWVLPFGPTAWLCGTRFINRADPKMSKASMNQALQFVKDEKVKLWIFPEGTRNTKDEFLPFKKGAFYTAITGQLPILPLVYSSYKGFMSTKHKYFNPGYVRVTCLPPIPTAGLTLEDMPALMVKVREEMMAVFTKANQEVRQPHPVPELALKSC